MNEPILAKMTASDIKCDNVDAGCDYYASGVKEEDYGDWLNKACPKCGENLLTQADYDFVILMRETINMVNDPEFVNSKLAKLTGITKEMLEADEKYSFSIAMDGKNPPKFTHKG
jgi:hypothetical protein